MRRRQSDPDPGDEGLEDELEAPEPADEAGDYFVIPVEVLERWRLDLHRSSGRFA